jgi:hypothetical protein
MYLVMQTMEAVLFRALLLSVPCWIVWRWSQKALLVPEDEVDTRPFRISRFSTREINHV